MYVLTYIDHLILVKVVFILGVKGEQIIALPLQVQIKVESHIVVQQVGSLP